MRAGAITGTRKQSADLFKGQSQCRRRSQRVGRSPERQMMPMRINAGSPQGKKNSDAGNQGVMNHAETKHPHRMSAENGPVRNHEEEARSKERGKQHQDAEIPDAVGIEVNFARGAESKHQCQENAYRGDNTVGRDDERTDVKEDGMHVTQG
jgi:hypothetical protein